MHWQMVRPTEEVIWYPALWLALDTRGDRPNSGACHSKPLVDGDCGPLHRPAKTAPRLLRLMQRPPVRRLQC